MRKWIGVLLVGSLVLLPLQISQAANPKSGGTCSKLNLKQTYLSKKYTCVKSGKKLIWDKGVVIAETSTQKANDVQPPIIANEPKSGESCTGSDSGGRKIQDGILYCVQVSDGSYKYIEHFNIDPVINNPTSPEPLEACETPDLRGSIPKQMMTYATAHDSVFPANTPIKHSGILNLIVVPIEFPDAIATVTPENIYRKHFDTLADWFNDFSNGKLKLNIEFNNSWTQMPADSTNYDAGGNFSQDYDYQAKITQRYVDATSDKIDYSQADLVVFVYPDNATKMSGWLGQWDVPVNFKSKKIKFAILSSFVNLEKYEPYWQWLAHETLHGMGLAMHFPANPPGWGIEWGRYSYDEGLLPWNQMILDWLNPDQYYCVTASNLNQTQITLVPQESNKPGMRTIFIRVSNSEALMVVSYRNDIWSYKTPNNFYGTMVALIDTSKQNDWSGEFTDDNFDGVKYQRPGVWLHPINQVKDDTSWVIEHTGEAGALMYLGDVINYKGISIKLINSNNFDTVQISKS